MNKPTIITVCYKSIECLYNAFYGSDYRVNLMICDEAHYGMSSHIRDDEKKENKIRKYDCIKFCDSFIAFTATPFEETMCKYVDGIKIEVIHDYSYAEAVRDGIVLPVRSNFYSSIYSRGSINGAVFEAYEDLKEKFSNTSAKLLVCGNGLEDNQVLFNSLIKKCRKEIENGTLAIAKIGSEGLTKDDEKIPSCEWVDSDQLMRYCDKNCECVNSDGYKICYNDERENKRIVFKNMHNWIDPRKNGGKHKNIIIIHCQMLGVGVDVPNINGVCILGNKEASNLYQSIMRPCRIAYYDRCVEREERLEDHFEVYVHTEMEVLDAIREFVDKLIHIGGISLIKAMVLNNVSGNGGKDVELLAKARELFRKKVGFVNVIEECNMIFDIDNFEKGLLEYSKLIDKYPDTENYIREQVDKFIRKSH